ncbi:hypothetical protein [Ancylobacter terrae]|uniref:hypothetical protein n=1 Tax=Ancylobacter sp. sgz301288 TaxID=3342077 RepID=UPI00385833F0
MTMMRGLRVLVLAGLSLLAVVPARSADEENVWCSCRGIFSTHFERYGIHSFIFHVSDRIGVTVCKTQTNAFIAAAERHYPKLKFEETRAWCSYSFKEDEEVAFSKKWLREDKAKIGSFFKDVLVFGFAGEGEPIAKSKERGPDEGSRWCDNEVNVVFNRIKDQITKIGNGRYCISNRRRGTMIECVYSEKRISTGGHCY